MLILNFLSSERNEPLTVCRISSGTRDCVNCRSLGQAQFSRRVNVKNRGRALLKSSWSQILKIEVKHTHTDQTRMCACMQHVNFGTCMWALDSPVASIPQPTVQRHCLHGEGHYRNTWQLLHSVRHSSVNKDIHSM